MAKEVFRDQLPYAAPGRFDFEFIKIRESGKYRIRDSHDNAMGIADTEEEASALVRQLNDR